MTSSDYKYTKIADLKEGDRDVNIYGIVKYFKKPIQTSTGQYNSLYTLVDESVKDDLEKGIRCHLFANSENDLPQVSKLGDVVRIHRAFIKFFNGRVQLQANKKAYSWLVISIDSIGDDFKVKSSHENFTFTTIDKRLVKNLVAFHATIPDLSEGGPVAEDLTLLKDISLNTFVNCVAKVIGIYKFDSNHCLLRITDGTKTSYSSLRQNGQMDQSTLVNCDAELMEAAKNHFFDISIYDDHVKVLDNLVVGDFIKVVNLHVKCITVNSYTTGLIDQFKLQLVSQSKGWAELSLHTGRSYGRGISIIQDDTRNQSIQDIESKVEELLRIHRALKVAEIKEHVPRPMQESLTTTDYLSQPFIPIQTIYNSSIPNKFRIRGKLIAIKPQSVEGFVVKVCGNCDEIYSRDVTIEICPRCPQFDLVRRLYFQLLIEDNSGLLQADVYGDEAEYFLNDISPEILLTDSGRRENIELKFEKLLDSSHNPFDQKSVSSLPWIEVCVFSFNSGTSQTSFRVFGTSLI